MRDLKYIYYARLNRITFLYLTHDIIFQSQAQAQAQNIFCSISSHGLAGIATWLVQNLRGLAQYTFVNLILSLVCDWFYNFHSPSMVAKVKFPWKKIRLLLK